MDYLPPTNHPDNQPPVRRPESSDSGEQSAEYQNPPPPLGVCADPGVQAGRLAMYEELTAVLSHEISNPIYAARLALVLIDQDLRVDGRETRFLGVLGEELGRVSAVIERLRAALITHHGAQSHVTLEELLAEIKHCSEAS